MFSRAEIYPSLGYQQQSYRLVHGGYFHSPNDHYAVVPGIPFLPSPKIAAPHVVPDGGWYNPNKQQPSWQNPCSNGQMSPYDCNKSPNFPGGDYSNGSNGQMSPHNFNKPPKFSGGSCNNGSNAQMSPYNYDDSSKFPGEYYSNGSNGHMSPYNHNHTSNLSSGWRDNDTDYYNQGSNGKMSAYNYDEAPKSPCGCGHGSYYMAHSSMGVNRCPSVYNYPMGLQNGEYTLKGVEEDED